MSLSVIGAGFGRTGTDSLKSALNILGYGPCHHMHEIMASEVQQQRWLTKAVGENIGWDSLFEGFNCAVDWPSARYWEELAALYPEAKVVLTHRSPESWWNSYSKTILPALMRFREQQDQPSMAWLVVGADYFEGRPDDKDFVLERYADNIARARSSVAPDRLIELELGNGWDALCAGLGVPVPDVPYPSGNTTVDFRTKLELD
ncbi:sulfotransferase family protein [Thetidibacter halocola]|uniref:Sulfotransferase family protein n=1 Tax=Thetidibacter halocola TaxID=2827239 RepID=A0A8J8B995_9RHOB|nr:sulfotransferase family protein [Thetidibacter halocola]MBS0125644.1 sulfotransferase family protein [Thetidibacter halocola]